MKLLLILLCVLALEVSAQYPTVTTQLSIAKEQTAHGLAVKDWITASGSDYVKGSNPNSQAFLGIVSKVVSANKFEYVPPGLPIVLTGLTAGATYYAQSDGTIGTASSSKPIGYAKSTTELVIYSGSFGVDLIPPSTGATQLAVTNITSTSCTVTVVRGNGTGVLITIGPPGLSTFPSANQFYTADPNFGDGDALGSAYAVFAEDGNSVDITGLTAETVYAFRAWEYSSSGAFIAYFPSPDVESFFTLADATTPIQSWIRTNIKSKETEITVTGTWDNGDNIVVVANDSIPVSIDISDGTNPVAADYGAGTHLGERNYVVYEGPGEQFTIGGLVRDTKYWFKVYEREDTGFLYNTQSPIDSAYAAWMYEGGTGAFAEGTGDPPGQVYLTALAGTDGVWYKFSNLTFADEANITNGDAGLADISAGTATAVIFGTPVTNEITYNGTHKTARTGSGSGINTGQNGNAWFTTATGFEIHWSGQVSDGRAGTSGQFSSFFGLVSNNTQVHFRVFDSGTAQMQLRDGTEASATNWAASAFLDDGPQNVVIQIRVDFVNDLITFYKNGTVFTSGYQGGPAFADQDFSGFNSTSSNFIVGNTYQSGSLTGNTNGATLSTAQFAITPLLSSDERAAIYEEFNYTAAAGAAFDEWDVIETDSYTQTTVDDTLNLSGAVTGFDNFMEWIEPFPDSLEEFRIVMGYKISAALTTAASGIGIGFINDVSDLNYSAFGHLNADTNAGQAHKLELFTGTGSAGYANMSFRSASSSAIAEAEDSVIYLIFDSKLLNNDRFVSIYAAGYADTVTTGYTIPNRPESAYFADGTMHPAIWYQGPGFKVFEFYVIRTGEGVSNTAPPPPPVTYDFRAEVGASNSNPCTDALPCGDLNLTISAATASGGSGKTVGIGPGTFTLTSPIIWTTNISLIEGSGKLTTTINGAPNLNGTYGFLSESKALIRAISSGATTVSQTLRGVTVSGGVDGSRLKANGLYIRNRNGASLGAGFVVDECRFEYFNTAGIWDVTSNNVQITNCDFLDTGGSDGQDATGYLPTGSTGNAATGAIMLYGPLTGAEIDECTINGTRYGTGYGIKSGGGCYGAGHMDDVVIDSTYIKLWPIGGVTNTTNNFAIEFHGGFGTNGCGGSNGNFGDAQISYCEIIDCSISFSSSTSTGNHRVNNTRMTALINNLNWFIEELTDDLEVDNNYFYSTGAASVAAAYEAGRTIDNHNYHNNIVEMGAPGIGGFFIRPGRGSLSWTNYVIEENTIIFNSSSGSQWNLISGSTNGTGGTLGVTIQNNAFYGDQPGNNDLFSLGNATFSSAVNRYNFGTHVNTNQSASGLTNSNNQTSLNGSAWFNFTGAKWPLVLGSYFALPGASSALWNAGLAGIDIGSYQHE